MKNKEISKELSEEGKVKLNKIKTMISFNNFKKKYKINKTLIHSVIILIVLGGLALYTTYSSYLTDNNMALESNYIDKCCVKPNYNEDLTFNMDIDFLFISGTMISLSIDDPNMFTMYNGSICFDGVPEDVYKIDINNYKIIDVSECMNAVLKKNKR